MDLQSLLDELGVGRKLAGQSRYLRRNPRPAAIPHLRRARNGLRELLLNEPNNKVALEFLSRACECLLEYREAIAVLNRLIALSPERRREHLKSRAALEAELAFWDAIGLSPSELEELGMYLKNAQGRLGGPGDHTVTREWAIETGKDPDKVVEGLRSVRGYSDHQIVWNITRC